jgi:hypothetical protein
VRLCEKRLGRRGQGEAEGDALAGVGVRDGLEVVVHRAVRSVAGEREEDKSLRSRESAVFVSGSFTLIPHTSRLETRRLSRFLSSRATPASPSPCPASASLELTSRRFLELPHPVLSGRLLAVSLSLLLSPPPFTKWRLPRVFVLLSPPVQPARARVGAVLPVSRPRESVL